MKVYVRGFRNKTEQEMEMELFSQGNVTVDYKDAPDDWIMTSSYEAERYCKELNRLRVYLDTHRCGFSIEQLSENQFAIVRLSHPETEFLTAETSQLRQGETDEL